MNEIIVSHGIKKKLQELFGKSHPFVRKALRGKSNDPIALRIRKAALENNGVEVAPVSKSNT